jgi:hypothetical protein
MYLHECHESKTTNQQGGDPTDMGETNEKRVTWSSHGYVQKHLPCLQSWLGRGHAAQGNQTKKGLFHGSQQKLRLRPWAMDCHLSRKRANVIHGWRDSYRI